MTMRRNLCFAIYFTLTTLVSGCALITPSHHRSEDYTPVFAAASAGDLVKVQQAVDGDPTLLKATEWDDATLLHDAVGQRHREVTVYLLDRGADINALTQDKLTPLHMSAQNGDLGMIGLLLDRGAKIDPVDAKGWTPLDRAEKWGHPDAVQFLERRGAHRGH